MKQHTNGRLLLRKKMKLQFLLPLTVTLLAMATMITLIFSNTYHLEESLKKYAETYANDVSGQLSERISAKFLQRSQQVSHLAETCSKMPDDVLTPELIERKKENFGVSRLFILKADGSTLPQGESLEGLVDYLKNEKEITSRTCTSFLEKNQVIYSAPFEKNGETHLAISINSGEKLQEILEHWGDEDDKLCCVANKKGTVIVGPSNMKPFMTVEKSFHDKALSKKNQASYDQMVKNITKGDSGLAVFQCQEGREAILVYRFIGVNDWMLLTLLPHDLFSNTIRGYTMKFIMVALLLILATFAIVALIILIYQKNMRRIKDAALTDPLTKGANQTAFRMKGEYLLRTCPEKKCALVYLNNKDFRSYNSRFGVQGGNNILCLIHSLLEKQLKEQELVSRCNGTSFCLLLEYETRELLTERIQILSQKIFHSLYDVYAINNHRIAQGAYLIPEKEEDYDLIQMLDWAKIASTYQEGESSCKIFDNSIVQILKREQDLDASFDQAIKDHEFKLFIQPKVCPKTDRLLGGEVLVRWEHPLYGRIPPNQFIPLFEKNGKICRLDLYMFEETCKLQKDWLEKGHHLPLSVNLSRAHLGSHNFAFLEQFQKLKEKYQIPDGVIELELTESMMFEQQEFPFVLEVMNRIQAMGFECSLDDFGYGYSSLTLLKDLNVNTIKLDRQFFLNESRKAWIVIGELIQMAHELDISVVAEGIESADQVKKLEAYHCDLIQGYVYAKPMSVSDFIDWAKF